MALNSSKVNNTRNIQKHAITRIRHEETLHAYVLDYSSGHVRQTVVLKFLIIDNLSINQSPINIYSKRLIFFFRNFETYQFNSEIRKLLN